jgi:hypothetical protein
LRNRHSEDLGGSGGVNILISGKCDEKLWVLAEMCQDTELNLRVIST